LGALFGEKSDEDCYDPFWYTGKRQSSSRPANGHFSGVRCRIGCLASCWVQGCLRQGRLASWLQNCPSAFLQRFQTVSLRLIGEDRIGVNSPERLSWQMPVRALRAFGFFFVAADRSRRDPVSPCQGRRLRRFSLVRLLPRSSLTFLYHIGSSGRDCESQGVVRWTPVTRAASGGSRDAGEHSQSLLLQIHTSIYFSFSLTAQAPHPGIDTSIHLHRHTLLLIRSLNLDAHDSS
jgi:hypothetical protein